MERERKRDMGRTQPAGALDGEGSPSWGSPDRRIIGGAAEGKKKKTRE